MDLLSFFWTRGSFLTKIQSLLCRLGLVGWGVGRGGPRDEKTPTKQEKKFQGTLYPSEDGTWCRFPKDPTKGDSGPHALLHDLWHPSLAFWVSEVGKAGALRGAALGTRAQPPHRGSHSPGQS